MVISFISKITVFKVIIFILLFTIENNISKSQNYQTESSYQKSYTSYLDYDTINYSNKIGFSVSSINFYGITYQRFVGNDWRLSVNGLIYLSSNDMDSEFMYNMGFSLHKILIKDGKYNVYILASAGYYYDENEYMYNDFPNDFSNLNKTSCFNTGIGLGAGFQLTKYLAIDAEIGYMYSTETNTGQSSLPITYNRIVPAFGLGAYICF
ncbi:MAG: hypothetical protein ACOVNU_11260 [Candidatus Kapaibacteriota bacterium]|jgi:hypothetical protein